MSRLVQGHMPTEVHYHNITGSLYASLVAVWAESDNCKCAVFLSVTIIAVI
jgi:hypothetical protein